MQRVRGLISRQFSSKTGGLNMPLSKKVKGKTTTEEGIGSDGSGEGIKGPVTETKDGHFAIVIQVRPGAKANSISGVSEEAVSVQIAAPPVDGEANTAIIKYFAQILNLKKGDVTLRGGKSRSKTVIVDPTSSKEGLSVEKVLDLLKNQKE